MLGDITEETAEHGVFSEGSKLGGQPGLIQDTGNENVDFLRNSGLDFLFQFDEQTVPNDMKYGLAPFGFGAMYAFFRFDSESRMIDEKVSSSFWQNS